MSTLTFEEFKATEKERTQLAEYNSYLETEKKAKKDAIFQAWLKAEDIKRATPEFKASEVVIKRQEGNAAIVKFVVWTLVVVGIVWVVVAFAPATAFSIPVTITN